MLIHIGFPKTATTWLQKLVLPQWKDIHYIDHYQAENKWLLDLRYVNELAFSWEIYKQKAITIKSGSLPAVISVESFAGDIFKRGFNTSRIARYLCSLFPKAKILITVREQLSMIDSLYRQYVNQGGTCRFKKFMELPAPKPVSFDPAFLDYYTIYELYERMFGKENILVVPYEEIKSKPEVFVNKLGSMLHVPVPESIKVDRTINKSLTGLSLAFLRIANYFLISPMQPGNLIPGKMWHPWLRKFLQNDWAKLNLWSVGKDILSNKDKDYFSSLYRESNHKLAQATGLDLQKWNYPL